MTSRHAKGTQAYLCARRRR